jgi:hypothetical protein
MPSPIAATALLEPIPRKPIPPKAAARFAARAFRALFRFPTRTVRKPLAVAALATIEPSRTGEKKDGLWLARRSASESRPWSMQNHGSPELIICPAGMLAGRDPTAWLGM